MKPYKELTRLGRLRRLRQLAEAALEPYGLAGATLLDLFTAAFYVYYILWMVGVDHLRPGRFDEDAEELMYRGAAFILRHVGSHE